LGINAKRGQRTQTAGQHQDGANLENRVPEKIESPNKRIRQETRRESDGESEAEEEIQEAKKKAESLNAFDGQPSVENWTNECVLSIEE